MEELAAPCGNALSYIVDIIIFGNTKEEHDEAVNQVLTIFKNNDVLLYHNKSLWRTNKLKFLGHILSDEAIAPDPDKISTILGFPSLQTKEETKNNIFCQQESFSC